MLIQRHAVPDKKKKIENNQTLSYYEPHWRFTNFFKFRFSTTYRLTNCHEQRTKTHVWGANASCGIRAAAQQLAVDQTRGVTSLKSRAPLSTSSITYVAWSTRKQASRSIEEGAMRRSGWHKTHVVTLWHGNANWMRQTVKFPVARLAVT